MDWEAKGTAVVQGAHERLGAKGYPAALAQILGHRVPRASLAAWVSGFRPPPAHIVLASARAARISLDYLVENDEIVFSGEAVVDRTRLLERLVATLLKDVEELRHGAELALDHEARIRQNGDQIAQILTILKRPATVLELVPQADETPPQQSS